MSADRLEARLAQLLSTPELSVSIGVAPVGNDTAAAVAVERVDPALSLASRLPNELRRRELQRVSPVTLRAVVSVAAGSGPNGRAQAMEAATLLWWRCEDDSIARAKGFPLDDLTEGYRVVDVRPAGWTTPDIVDGGPMHRIELDIDALLWPREKPADAGKEFEHVLIRLSGEGQPVPVRVTVGGQVEVTIDLDLRAFVVEPKDPPGGHVPPPPRAVLARVVPRGDVPVGTVPAAPVPLTGTRASVLYVAGAQPGRDELHFFVAGAPGDVETPVGFVDVEVTT